MPKKLMDEIEALVQAEVERRVAALIGKMDSFTVSEAAQRLGLADSTVYGLVRTGKLHTIGNPTSRVLIPASEIERVLNKRAA